jgi:hypothetical protein
MLLTSDWRENREVGDRDQDLEPAGGSDTVSNLFTTHLRGWAGAELARFFSFCFFSAKRRELD